MNGTPFDTFEQNRFTIIKAVGNNSLIMVYDSVTGIVSDINTVNGYSGAYCYSNYQTTLADDVGNYVSKFGTDNAISIGSGIAISAGVAILVCCGPPGWIALAAIGLIGIGVLGDYYASHLNEGYTNQRAATFALSVSTAAIPFIGESGVAGDLTVNYVTSNGFRSVVNTISTRSETNVITAIPTKIGTKDSTGFVYSEEYVNYGNTQRVVRTVFGNSRKDAVQNGLVTFGSDTASTLVNDYNPNSGKYTSTTYNNISAYSNSL